jgi:hypothetical protein
MDVLKMGFAMSIVAPKERKHLSADADDTLTNPADLDIPRSY